MLSINLSPVRSDENPLTANLAGTVLTVNEIEYDLALIPDGATVEDHLVLQNVTRMGDNYQLTLVLPHGKNAPKETRFPQPIKVNSNGPIKFPIYNIKEPRK